jgi:hypothetical protein
MEDVAYRDDLAYHDDTVIYGGPARVSWGAIWAGVFTFSAIWAVFETLGFAIFASRANPNAATPVTGQSMEIAIWSIILTIIAMYVAGRETGRLAAVTNRHDGLIHGMIMFGLSVVSAIILTSLAGAVLSGGNGIPGTSVHSGYTLGVFAGLGWAGFVALLLGWLAAMGGGSQAVARRNQPPTRSLRDKRDIRPAA